MHTKNCKKKNEIFGSVLIINKLYFGRQDMSLRTIYILYIDKIINTPIEFEMIWLKAVTCGVPPKTSGAVTTDTEFTIGATIK